MFKKKNRKVLVNETKADTSVCSFCGELPNDDYGKFFTSKMGFSVHQYCMFFAAALAQNGRDEEGFEGFLEKDVFKEIKRASRLRCGLCGKKGASCCCSHQHCKKAFHFTCGLQKKYLFQFFGKFSVYCSDHRLYQNAPSFPWKTAPCPICLEHVQCISSPDILTTPCCKDVWFHRACVQKQAEVSGYFFRCAVCNNKSKFLKEMQRMGIFVRDRDAAWEEGDNFAELLQTYNQCDHTICICPNGRKYSNDSGKWKLILCSSCGQYGTHAGCRSWPSGLSMVCPTCQSVFERLQNQVKTPTVSSAVGSKSFEATNTSSIEFSVHQKKRGVDRCTKKAKHRLDTDTDYGDITAVVNGLKRRADDDILNYDTSFSVQRAIAAGTAVLEHVNGKDVDYRNSETQPQPENRKRKADDSEDDIVITKYVPGENIRQGCEICPKCNRRKPPTSHVNNTSLKISRKHSKFKSLSHQKEQKSVNSNVDKIDKNEAILIKDQNMDVMKHDKMRENTNVTSVEVLELAAKRTDESSVLLLPSKEILRDPQETDVSNGSFWYNSVERLCQLLMPRQEVNSKDEPSKESESTGKNKELSSSSSWLLGKSSERDKTVSVMKRTSGCLNDSSLSLNRQSPSSSQSINFEFLSKRAGIEAVIDHAIELKNSSRERKQACISS
ncbi:uncharacterized protein LOC124454120 [Xenia sp. Carnegie-2017]|uniref:uncharacterized protein LOC124454120 n=1 Tax=Xenia sp. Carnegie-2017 TaxID=2897299 RepID=UPI001F04D8EC|nr:uncharacterized protein LOC124454120 [Xenia sp. Carnegie-2017]